jgi:hypothetical protein
MTADIPSGVQAGQPSYPSRWLIIVRRVFGDCTAATSFSIACRFGSALSRICRGSDPSHQETNKASAGISPCRGFCFSLSDRIQTGSTDLLNLWLED